jgi:aspartate/methionine/tyrosine aminotransferase
MSDENGRAVSAAMPDASRRSAVAPFLAMDVLAEAGALEREGRSVIHMEVGQPGAPAPRAVREAAMAALAHGRIGYTEALGIAPLRERIARHYRDTYGVEVSASRVVVTTGSSGGFILSFLAMFDHGARLAIQSPGYPAYRNILEAIGIAPVEIETGPADRWAMTGASIEHAHAEAPLAGVLAMSPANPTGVMMDEAQLADLAATCRRLGLWFVSDEIYHGLTFARPAATALAFDPDAVIVNSFSKYYCMTGWRVGWLIVPERLVRPIERLAQSFFISSPALSQVAALAAFDATEELEEIKASYARNRARLMEALPALGLTVLPMDGAFYAYCDAARVTNDSMDFCRRMLREAGVAATPGADFDRARGARFLRFSFAGSEADIEEGIKRLRGWRG